VGPRLFRGGHVVAGGGPLGDEGVDDDVADAVGGVQGGLIGAVVADLGPVSYTHLDVYKRQVYGVATELVRGLVRRVL